MSKHSLDEEYQMYKAWGSKNPFILVSGLKWFDIFNAHGVLSFASAQGLLPKYLIGLLVGLFFLGIPLLLILASSEISVMSFGTVLGLVVADLLYFEYWVWQRSKLVFVAMLPLIALVTFLAISPVIASLRF